MIDNLVLKAVECKAGAHLQNLLKHHNYLMYYPHHSVITALVTYHVQQKEFQHLNTLANIFETRKLIKLESLAVEKMIECAFANKDIKLAFVCFNIC